MRVVVFFLCRCDLSEMLLRIFGFSEFMTRGELLMASFCLLLAAAPRLSCEAAKKKNDNNKKNQTLCNKSGRGLEPCAARLKGAAGPPGWMKHLHHGDLLNSDAC